MDISLAQLQQEATKAAQTAKAAAQRAAVRSLPPKRQPPQRAQPRAVSPSPCPLRAARRVFVSQLEALVAWEF